MLNRSFVSLAVLCLGFVNVAAAEPPAPTVVSDGHRLIHVGALQVVDAPPVDLRWVTQDDVERELDGLPLRFAIPNVADVSPKTHGVWEGLDADRQVWRLRIRSAGAASLNLGFAEYEMPEAGRLSIYSPDLQIQLPPFTADDNASHGELWTPIIPADEIVLEVTLPPGKEDDLRLKLSSINVGYREFGDTTTPLSGSCNVDVVCSDGDDWRNEIPAIAGISTGGSLFCTGFMVNNTAQDRTPYFMTANHCGIGAGNAASLVVYWNFETSSCGGAPNGSLSQFQSGSFFRASYSPSDFTLVELDEDPDPSWNITFAGWDHSGADATSAVAIHHPSGDEKRISFENQPTTTTSYLNNAVPGNGTHVRVTDWDLGTTEGGSSGSPLFDQNHHVIGQLHGGYASCSSQTSDWYGKFSVSWTGGGSTSSRLSDWLDPLGTGQSSLDTIGGGPTLRYESHVVDDSAGNGDGILDPGETVILEITTKNSGTESASSISGTLSSPTALVGILDGDADWPDLADQQSAVSNAPHMAIEIDPSFECGGLVELNLDHAALQLPGAWSSGFQLQVGTIDPGEIEEYNDDMEQGINSWSTQELAGTNAWAQSTTRANSPTHSWFVADIASVSDSLLISPTINALPSGAKLRFRHFLNSEASSAAYDGGLLEYTTDGSSWLDAGNLITQGGYNAVISSSYSSPIGGRSAWSGDFGGWQTVEVDLSALAGADVAFRWRFATDSSVSDEGWFVDDVQIVRNTFTCNPAQLAPPGEASEPGLGAPFRIDPNGGGYDLAWSAPLGGGSVNDYVLYATPLTSPGGSPVCVDSIGSGTATVMAALPDNSCFLVVARNGAGEGSYGQDGSGAEREEATGGVCP